MCCSAQSFFLIKNSFFVENGACTLRFPIHRTLPFTKCSSICGILRGHGHGKIKFAPESIKSPDQNLRLLQIHIPFPNSSMLCFLQGPKLKFVRFSVANSSHFLQTFTQKLILLCTKYTSKYTNYCENAPCVCRTR